MLCAEGYAMLSLAIHVGLGVVWFFCYFFFPGKGELNGAQKDRCKEFRGKCKILKINCYILSK